MISIVVPVFNRLENVKRMLRSFVLQRDAPEFEVVIVDDGSTDGLKDLILDYNQKIALGDIEASFNISYLSGGPNKGFRGGRARNIGTFNSEGEWLLFTDSDIILNQNALSNYGKAIEAVSEDTIIIGPYHWLEPMVITDDTVDKIVTYGFDDVSEMSSRLGIQIDKTKTATGIIGMDPRSKDFKDSVTETSKGNGLGAFSGNICYSRNLYTRLGGFDEAMVGHGGEDADLGLTADEAGANWLLYKPVYGWHIWHPRNQERNEKEVKTNILYIDAKHSVGAYANTKKWVDSRDYSDPAAYVKHLGAIAIKISADATVYVARPDLRTRIGVSSMEWLNKLGFDPEDIKTVEFIELHKYDLKGATRD